MLSSPMLSEMFDFMLKQYHITMMQTNMDVFNGMSVIETTIRVAFNPSNPHIYLAISTHLQTLEIGIWEGKTADISIFDFEVGEVLYGYHDYFDNLEDLKQVVIKVFSHFKV